MTQESDHIPTA